MMIEEAEKSDAIRQLHMLKSLGAWITRSPQVLLTLTNGIPYYFVEVTCDTGSQFGITAYGDEAIELLKEVDKMKRFGPTTITDQTN